MERGYSALRKGRYSKTNHIYHLVFSTKKREPLFKDISKGRKFVSILKEDEARGNSKTLAFVVMPDHVHWLMELGDESLAQCVKRIKSISSRQIKDLRWDEGFYDHLIRDDENLQNVARYIVANPLRAGLVKSVRDYSLWDAIWL